MKNVVPPTAQSSVSGKRRIAFWALEVISDIEGIFISLVLLNISENYES